MQTQKLAKHEMKGRQQAYKFSQHRFIKKDTYLAAAKQTVIAQQG